MQFDVTISDIHLRCISQNHNCFTFSTYSNATKCSPLAGFELASTGSLTAPPQTATLYLRAVAQVSWCTPSTVTRCTGLTRSGLTRRGSAPRRAKVATPTATCPSRPDRATVLVSVRAAGLGRWTDPGTVLVSVRAARLGRWTNRKTVFW